MEIMSRNLVVVATETTKNADFKIECSGEGGAMKRVTVNVYGKNSGEDNYIGNINLDNESLSCSLKCSDKQYIGYFSDFSFIVEKLKVEMNQNNVDSGSGGGNGDGGIVDDPTA